MLKQSLRYLVLAVCLVALPKGFAEPRDGWRLENRVPASTLALVTLEDVGLMKERFDRTAIAGLFREPEMKAFVAPIEKAIEQKMEDGGGDLFGEAQPIVMNLIEQLGGLRGQVAVALLDVNLDRGEPRIAASLDFGPHLADFLVFLGRMKMQLDPKGEAIEQFEKDGRLWWRNRGGGPPVTATTVDTAFVIATDPDTLAGVVAGESAESLGASAHFPSVRRRVTAGGDLALMAYANVPAILRLVEPMFKDEGVKAIANALGLDTVKAAAYGMSFSGDGFMDTFVLHTPGADHGIVKLMEMPPYEPQMLRFVPANAFFYNESNVTLGELVPNIRRLGASVSPDFADGMNEGLGHLRNMLGVDIETELLAGLAGPSGSYVAMPQTGGLYPEVALFLKVKDPAAFESVFDRLARGIAGAVTEEGDVIASTRTLEYREQRLHLFEMQAAHGKDVVPFTPTWAMLDDWLVVTLVPHAMKEIVLRAQQQLGAAAMGGGLAAQEDFQALRAIMPKAAGEITYVDLQALLNLLYDTAVPLLQTAAKPNVLGRDVPFPLDWAQLPAARTARPYFRSLGVFTTWNENGIAIQMHGPIPLVGVVMVAAAVAVPVFVGARAQSHGARVVRRPRRPMPPRPVKKEATEEAKPKPSDVAPKPSAVRRAHLQVEQLSGFVRVFLLTEARLPERLEQLVEADILQSIPSDPWGRPFVLKVIDEKTRRFQVFSAGPDGVPDTDDDIRSGG